MLKTGFQVLAFFLKVRYFYYSNPQIRRLEFDRVTNNHFDKLIGVLKKIEMKTK
jgi:hypothetical protein